MCVLISLACILFFMYKTSLFCVLLVLGTPKRWSKEEVAAVMRHFKGHITRYLATKEECRQCHTAEEPVLQNRTVQNIRD